MLKRISIFVLLLTLTGALAPATTLAQDDDSDAPTFDDAFSRLSARRTRTPRLSGLSATTTATSSAWTTAASYASAGTTAHCPRTYDDATL